MPRFGRTQSTTQIISQRPTLLPSLFSDSAIVAITLTPSAVENRESSDVGTVLLTLTPDVVEFQQTGNVDSATVLLTLTPSGIEFADVLNYCLNATLDFKWQAAVLAKWASILESNIYTGVGIFKWAYDVHPNTYVGDTSRRWNVTTFDRCA